MSKLREVSPLNLLTAIYSLNLKGCEKALLQRLILGSNNITLESKLSQVRIEADIGISLSSIKRGYIRLKEEGYIMLAKKGNQVVGPSTYLINDEFIMLRADDANAVRKPDMEKKVTIAKEASQKLTYDYKAKTKKAEDKAKKKKKKLDPNKIY